MPEQELDGTKTGCVMRIKRVKTCHSRKGDLIVPRAGIGRQAEKLGHEWKGLYLVVKVLARIVSESSELKEEISPCLQSIDNLKG